MHLLLSSSEGVGKDMTDSNIYLLTMRLKIINVLQRNLGKEQSGLIGKNKPVGFDKKKLVNVSMSQHWEKAQLQKIVDSWKDSSKNRWKLVNSGMSSTSKVGLGYEIKSNDEVLSYEEEMNRTVFNCTAEDFIDKPLYSRFTKTNNFKGVLHPLSGDYTPKPQQENSYESLPNVNTGRANVNYVRSNVNYVRHKCSILTGLGSSLTDRWRTGIFDSGCSRHMTGNKDHLDDFEECKGGSVTFGGSKVYITDKGRIRHKVLFTETECLAVSLDFKMPDENQILLKGKDIKVKKSKNEQKPTRNEETSTRERFEANIKSRIKTVVGLDVIAANVGKLIRLDAHTTSICLNSWGRSDYARALVEISAESPLVNSVDVEIPLDENNKHVMVKVNIEYEWQPPRCGTCKVFDHLEAVCPKKQAIYPKKSSATEDKGKQIAIKPVVNTGKKNTDTKVSTQRYIKGYRVNNPKTKLVYSAVVKPQTDNHVSNNMEQSSNTTKPPLPPDSSKDGKPNYISDDISFDVVRKFINKSIEEESILEYIGNNTMEGCSSGEIQDDNVR
ncbi:hypothetical protein Tco_0303392 [Tanacetum coccineum]